MWDGAIKVVIQCLIRLQFLHIVVHVDMEQGWTKAVWWDLGAGTPRWIAHRVTGLEQANRAWGMTETEEIICLWHPKETVSKIHTLLREHIPTSRPLINLHIMSQATSLYHKKQGLSPGLNNWIYFKMYTNTILHLCDIFLIYKGFFLVEIWGEESTKDIFKTFKH